MNIIQKIITNTFNYTIFRWRSISQSAVVFFVSVIEMLLYINIFHIDATSSIFIILISKLFYFLARFLGVFPERISKFFIAHSLDTLEMSSGSYSESYSSPNIEYYTKKDLDYCIDLLIAMHNKYRNSIIYQRDADRFLTHYCDIIKSLLDFAIDTKVAFAGDVPPPIIGHIIETYRTVLSYDPYIIYSSRDADILILKDMSRRKKAMDPVTLLSVIGSITSIISLLQQNKENISVANIRRIFQQKNTVERAAEGTDAVTVEDYEKIVVLVVDSFDLTKDFLERITKKCIEKYRSIINSDASEDEIGVAFDVARRCVCMNLSLLKKSNGGVLPEGFARMLWEKYNCGML